MKTLYVLRHAKSDWDDPGVPDHDRPLAPRGQRATRLVAAHLRRRRIRPEVVLCSSATRARETLEGIRAALGGRASVLVEEDLYGATAAELLARLRRVGDGTRSVMVIGHNPGMQDLTLGLAGDGDDAVGTARHKFPTAALATLSIPVDEWTAVAAGTAYLEAVMVPRQLQ